MKKFLLLLTLLFAGIGLVACAETEEVAYSDYTYLSIEMNPAVDFVIDSEGKVYTYSFRNEEAEIVAAGLEMEGKTYEEALHLYLNAAIDTGYIDITREDGAVMIQAGGKKDSENNEFMVQVQEKLQIFFQENAIGAVVLKNEEVDEEAEALVETYDISYGFAKMILAYVKAELTFLRRNQIPFPAMITSSIFKDRKKKLWSVMIIRDLTEAKEVENSLRQAKAENEIMATHDFLTGLLNRRGFMKRVEEMMGEVSDGFDFGLLLIDIDYFKEFNDKHGHIKGDYILKDFAEYLKQSLIEDDALVGRFGGDEFIVFFRNTSEIELNNVAENIRSKVEHMDFTSETGELNLTISIGVTVFPKGVDTDIDDIISFADSNMYRAKKVRNSVYYKKMDITLKDL